MAASWLCMGRAVMALAASGRLRHPDRRMDYKLFGATFVAVFLAELGDKTQLATMSLAAAAPMSRWTVLAASVLALAMSSVLAVLVGGFVSRVIAPHWIQRGAGTLFIVLGALMLWSARLPPTVE